jgi:uncharacterized protein YheU (UPF0270 family)
VSDENNVKQQEEGVEVPYRQIDPETLRRMIQEFVSRDGADWGDAGCALDDKVEQVLQQLQHKQVKVVFDLRSQTVNIVACGAEPVPLQLIRKEK